MSILVTCGCGQSYPIKEQFAGQRVKCPSCNRILTVPGTGVIPLPTSTRAAPAQPNPSDDVVQLPLSESVPAQKRPMPVRALPVEPVVDLPVVEDDDAPSSVSSSQIVLIFAVVFVLLLGGGGATIWFILRDDKSDSSAAATDKDDKKEEKKQPANESRPDRKDLNRKDTDKKAPDKKEPDKKEADKKEPEEKMPPVAAGPWQGHHARILGVGFARDGRLAMSGSGGEVKIKEKQVGASGEEMIIEKRVPASDTTLRLWDPATGKELKRLDGFPHGLSVVAFDPTGTNAVVTEIADGKDARPGAFDLHVWDLGGKREVRTLKGHEKGVLCAAFTFDGRRLVSGGQDARLRLWDVETGTQVGDGFPHPGWVTDLALSNDARLAVTACSDRTVRIYDLNEKKMLKAFPRHQDIVWCVAISPDGKLAASGGGGDYDATRGEFVAGSRDYEIRLWDVATGQELRRFTGHQNEVRALAFSQDSRRLLSAGFDKTVRLWHVASGRELGRFEEHRDLVQCAAFFPDGGRALSGGYDRTLRVWILPPDLGDLAKRLQEPGADRVEILREIARYGPEAKDVAPALLKLLGDADPNVKRAALETLTKVGTVGLANVKALVPLLKDAGFPEGRQFALDALTTLGRDAQPALPELLALLKDRNTAQRLKVIGVIAAIGADARATAYSPLLELLRDPEMEVAKAAADSLSKLGKPTKAELPTLTGFLTDKGEPIREYALRAVTDLGDEAKEALPAILKVLEKDDSAALRMLALAALLKLQNDGKALIVPLTKALTDTDPKVVVKAAESLAALPPETGVLPVLLKAMEHTDPAVQKIADNALENFPFTKEHVQQINDGLQSKRDPVRLRMLKAAAKLGPDGAGALPGLIEVVKASTGEVRTTAISLLGDLGPKAREAGPVLLPLLKEGDRKSRLAICLVLGKIEADEAKQAVPFLVGLLKVDNEGDAEAVEIQNAAKETLVKIGEPAINDLLKALTNDFAGGSLMTPEGIGRATGRLAAVQTLEMMGARANKNAVKLVLAKMEANDTVLVIRAAARKARNTLQEAKP